MQLSPFEVFTLARGLEDHTDATAYFVRATIRNARTDELLDTVVLTNRGDNHRYSAEWQVPADVSGQGFYIVITTSVYTDSGYTTKSTTYGDKYDTYLVADRMNPNLGMGGGADVDYRRIQKMIETEVAKIPKPEKTSIPAPDLSAIIEGLEDVMSAIRNIRFPEQKETDLSGVLKKMDALDARSRDALNENLDRQNGLLEDHEDRVARSLADFLTDMEALKTRMDGTLTNIRKFFSDDVDAIRESIEKLEKSFSSIPYLILNDPKLAGKNKDL